MRVQVPLDRESLSIVQDRTLPIRAFGPAGRRRLRMAETRVRISQGPFEVTKMPYKDKETQRKFQRLRVARIRKEWMSANGPCVKCGSDDRLEVDHIVGELKVSHRVWSWSEVRRSAELSKCQVLCHECHLKKSRVSGQQPPARQHGNRLKYEVDGCRCALCRAAHTEFQRNWRKQAGL